MAHGDFAIMSRRTGDEVAVAGTLEGVLVELNGHEPARGDFGYIVVEYHNYRKVPLFECSDLDETKRKIRAKIGELGPGHARRL